jgi:DNA-binding MarR family transcriptional regulator
MNNLTGEYRVNALKAAQGADDGSMLALLEAARCIQEKLEVALEAVGLSPAKFQALDALVKAGEPLALSELAGCLKCVRSNITQLADRLESDGLVKRVDDPTDRRAIRAVVTQLGIERHSAGVETIRELQDSFAERVGPAERNAFHRVLSALKS